MAEKAPERPRVLLTGATGYIGGSVLTKLIDRNGDERIELVALVRKEFQASILKDAGVTPVLFKGWEDFEVIRETAGGCDAVIACGSARNTSLAKALLFGLGERKAATGKDVYYIHTSGSSMLSDQPVTGIRIDTKIYSDVEDNVWEIENTCPDEYGPVRACNQLVVELGKQEGVKTFIVVPPLIFGRGKGFFSEGVGQAEMMAKLAFDQKKGVILGDGSGIWNRVHIEDLMDLYSLLFEAAFIEKRTDVPSGKQGYYFAENGFQSWKSIAERIVDAAKGMGEKGSFEIGEVEGVETEVVADEWFGGDVRDAEAVLGSNSRTKADKARKALGWEPKWGEEAFWEEVDDVAHERYLLTIE